MARKSRLMAYAEGMKALEAKEQVKDSVKERLKQLKDETAKAGKKMEGGK